MSKLRKKALAGMLAGTVAHSAGYDPATQRYTGQRAMNDPWLAKIMGSGQEFWASRGVQLPKQIALDVADDLRGDDTVDGGLVAGRAWSEKDYGQARVALDAGMVRQTLKTARDKRRTTRDRREALQRLASTMLHEMGHAGNVEHREGEDAGFMGPNGGGTLVPQETARVIRRLLPRQKQKIRPGRGIG